MLGDRIKQFRTAKRFTQEKLSEELDVSTGYISELETGRRTPSVPMVLRLAELFECSPNDLFEYEETEDRCGCCKFKISDKTTASTLDLMKSLPPEENFKIYSYAKDLEQLYRLKSAN